MKKKMYTCLSGRNLFKARESFWAWDEESISDSDFIIEVDEGGYLVDDDGLYHIKDLEMVSWLNGDSFKKQTVTVREVLRMINKDIADGKDEEIWYMGLDDYLLRHRK